MTTVVQITPRRRERKRTTPTARSRAPARPAFAPAEVVGLVFYSALGDAGYARLLSAESDLHAAGYAVDWVGDGRALAKRLVEGRRWAFVFTVGDGALWAENRRHIEALGALFEQPVIDGGTPGATIDLPDATAPSLGRDLV